MTATRFPTLPELQPSQTAITPELGLVYITVDQQVRFRTMTRTR
jgi:UV DNA damage endonuclease